MRHAPPIAAAVLACCAALPSCSKDQGSPPPAAQPRAPAPTTATPASATGAVEGLVRWKGPVPEARRVPLPASVHRQCGESIVQRDVQVGPAGELAWAVVWLDGPPRAGGEAPAAVLDQRRCAFLPPVLAARAGSAVTLVNSDPLIHNVRQASGSDRPFNAAMPLEGMRMPMPLPATPTVLRLTCDVHPWMAAWARTFDHPHFAVTDAAGRFRLPAVPGGAGTLKLWHPALGERAFPVDIPAGGVARPEIEWAPPTRP